MRAMGQRPAHRVDPLAVRVPLDPRRLPEPCYRRGIPRTDTAKRAVAMVCSAVNTQLHSVLAALDTPSDRLTPPIQPAVIRCDVRRAHHTHTLQEISMDDASTIPMPAMAEHLAAGDAQALLPDGVPGPVRLAGQWWAVPTGHTHYRPVTDRAALAHFDTGLARLTAQRQHQAALHTHTGQQRP